MKRLMLFLLLLLLPRSISAQAPEDIWLQPIWLGQGWFPSVTVDARGLTHVVWGSSIVIEPDVNVYTDLYMYALLDELGLVTEPNDIVFAAKGGWTIRNAIDVDSQGILHTFFRSNLNHDYMRAPANEASRAPDWQYRRTMGTGYYVDMMVDSQDNIHLISSAQGVNVTQLGLKTEQEITQASLTYPCLNCADLLYYRSTDGGQNWERPVNLSNDMEGSERQNIFEGPSGRLYITWTAGLDWYTNVGQPTGARFVYSDDYGQTWSEPVIMQGDSDLIATHGMPVQFEMTELGNGVLLAVWRYSLDADNRIYYQLSDDWGETWTLPETIPYVYAPIYNTLDKYALVTDKQGIAHLFAVAYDEETGIGPAVYHVEYRQERWLRPVRLFYDANVDGPEYVQAAVGPQNSISVAWFTRKRQTGADTGDLNVYYTQRRGNMADTPLITAYPPTPTPIVTPTVVPTFAPTDTPFPTIAPLDTSTADIRRNRDQSATQTLLVALAAAGAVCVAVLVIAGFRPRL